MNNYFNINYARIGILMLPTFLRKPLTVAFVKAMMKPLDKLNTSFTMYREALDTNVYSQVCYMQGILNDRFDPLERRIKIRNTDMDRSSFLYWRESVNKPVRISMASTRRENRDGQIGTDYPSFKIVLPIGFTLSDSENAIMRSMVNQNKLASKNYIITNG